MTDSLKRPATHSNIGTMMDGLTAMVDPFLPQPLRRNVAVKPTTKYNCAAKHIKATTRLIGVPIICVTSQLLVLRFHVHELY